MTLSPECLIYWASGDFLSGVDTEIDTEIVIDTVLILTLKKKLKLFLYKGKRVQDFALLSL